VKGDMRWKFWLVIILTLLSVIFVIPSLLGSKLPHWWKSPLPTDKVHLGLDLQGGMHLVLGVKLEKAIQNSLDVTVSSLKDEIRKKGAVYDYIKRLDARSIEINLVKADFAPKVEEILNDYFTFSITHPYQGEQTKFLLTFKEAEVQRLREATLDQAQKTITDRIDQFGVSEPTVAKHGEDQILVQLPGVKDTQRAIDLIGKTAQLEFKLVDDEHSVDKALQGEIPEEDEILYERSRDKATGQVTKKPYLLKKRSLMTGDLLTDARIQPGEYGTPYVTMTFNKFGATLFEQITGENTGKRLAIILDDNVYSAPVIREKIGGGRAQITGNFTDEEARDLAIVLRAGALPAPVEILEQRTVGPSLGYDSIRMGIISFIIGTVLVILFSISYYKLSGIVANIATFVNVLMVLAFLAAFKATLTMPGIAGIVLTVGMAMDNVIIIYERIREELDLGKTVGAAIEAGYNKAFSAVWDSAMTNVIAAMILYAFGTGPVKGFAVTLSIGLIGGVFTAVVLTHVIFDWFLMKRKITKLSI
jgi:preprotein translocase subunit SecD